MTHASENWCLQSTIWQHLDGILRALRLKLSLSCSDLCNKKGRIACLLSKTLCNDFSGCPRVFTIHWYRIHNIFNGLSVTKGSAWKRLLVLTFLADAAGCRLQVCKSASLQEFSAQKVSRWKVLIVLNQIYPYSPNAFNELHWWNRIMVFPFLIGENE